MAKGRGAVGKLSPQRIAAKRRQAKAIELRAEGWSLAEIAVQCGYASPSGAAMAISRGLQQTVSVPAAALRKTIDSQLDRVAKAVLPQVDDGDLKAADIIIKVADRRSKLWGLDGGEQVDPVDTSKQTRKKENYNDDQAAQIIQLLAETQALNQLVPDGMVGGQFFLEDGSLIGDDSDIPLSDLDEEEEIARLTAEFNQGAVVLANGDMVIPPRGY